MSQPEDGLWPFSLAVYAAPGVEAACLALQDRGLDVNVALWIAWTSGQGRDARGALDEAMKLTARWAPQVTAPLRAARNGLKPAPAFVEAGPAKTLRAAILELELEAERLHQGALEPLSTQCPQAREEPETLCREGLDAYAARLGVRADSARFVESIFSALKKE